MTHISIQHEAGYFVTKDIDEHNILCSVNCSSLNMIWIRMNTYRIICIHNSKYEII
jgi:hypothetical protein